MATPEEIKTELVRWATLTTRQNLLDMYLACADAAKTSGGKMATSLSANGKSFGFQVDSRLTVSELLVLSGQALSYFDNASTEEKAARLNAIPRKTTVGGFR